MVCAHIQEIDVWVFLVVPHNTCALQLHAGISLMDPFPRADFMTSLSSEAQLLLITLAMAPFH